MINKATTFVLRQWGVLYSADPAAGHIDTGFLGISLSLSRLKQMFRWMPIYNSLLQASQTVSTFPINQSVIPDKFNFRVHILTFTRKSKKKFAVRISS